ncbi:hypothetical protein ACFV0O_00150 [Kitasatospora sp. NPDC059577]|uniref:hypothetical protein n=1 Tax=unclassified Kitasatospora TaxID=2633591 RepID=UPI00368C1ADD
MSEELAKSAASSHPTTRDGRPTAVAPRRSNTVTITPVFRLVFFSVLGLTVASLVTTVWLVLAVHDPNDQAKSLVENLLTIAKLGVGAIFGLLGGKAVK